MRIFLFSVSVLVLLCSSSLEAAVWERDFVDAGDGLLTYDDVNEREWLDLPYTFDNLSVVKSLMEPGEQLADFHFATFEDVEQLMASAEVSQAEFPTFSLLSSFGVEGPGPKELVDLLGYILRAEGGLFGEFQYTIGQVAVGFDNGEPVFDDNNAVVFSLTSEGLEPGGINTPLLLAASSGGYDSSPPIELISGEAAGEGDIGPFWLYRNVVPEPSALVTTLIAIIVTLLSGRCSLGLRG